MASQVSIMWFRRDLRLDDHPALAMAASAGPVVGLFVLDPAFRRSGAPRRRYLAARLGELQRMMDGALVVLEGDPVEVVPALAERVGAARVHVTRDHTPYGRRRDAAVAERLRLGGASLIGTGSNYAVEPGTVTKADGTPYGVFTPFSRSWRAVGWGSPVDVPEVRWHRVDVGVAVPAPAAGVPLPAVTDPDVGAQWERFRDGGLGDYDSARNLPGVAGTSRLSAALRWGVLHPRGLLADIDHAGRDRVFASELAWREFYADVLLRRPDSASVNIDRRMDALPCDTDAPARERFERWCAGTTGFPLVDAGMRELAATGWMHNRVRMVVASFLTKDLHLPWQWGAGHFMRSLVDGDLASNAHGWQWTAGTGTDAAPFFRVFNPVAQSRRFDPDGVYIRAWVPELAHLDPQHVHEPGAHRPEEYPPPMVDHAVERLEALARYQQTKRG